jgi:hypothetical protein
MRLSGFLRRRKAASATPPTWEDNRPTWGAGASAGRYLEIPEIDRWRAVPFDMPPDPERGTVMQRVRQLVESLDGAIDEGTGSALDLLIESWVAAWIHTVETSYADHCAVIDVHAGQAAEWLVESEHNARDEAEELDRARAAYLACRARLSGEPEQPGPAAGQDPDDTAPHDTKGDQQDDDD